MKERQITDSVIIPGKENTGSGGFVKDGDGLGVPLKQKTECCAPEQESNELCQGKKIVDGVPERGSDG